MIKENLKVNIHILSMLTKRAIKIFLKDKANVFFSLLSPLIVLILYILFLGEMQVNSIMGAVPAEFALDKTIVKAYIDSWMLAGVVGSACITVSLGANNIMVKDKEQGMINDMYASPIKKWVITFSYFLFNFIITVFIATIAFIVCILYLIIGSKCYFTFPDIIKSLGLIILSALSSTLITTFISSFIKSESVLGAFTGITSAVLGFLIGAYMPMSVMPNVAQYISSLVPGTHSVCLFRKIFMSGSFNELVATIPSEIATDIDINFTSNINFFGHTLGSSAMILGLVISIVVFCVLNIIVANHRKSKNAQ